MKRQIARKTAPKTPANKKSDRRPPHRTARKVVQDAQMTNYLLEEHPEFGQC